METHELDIEITPDGQVKVHIHGAKGAACMEYAELLQNVMGAEGELQHTSEFYEPPTGVRIHLQQTSSD